MVQNAVAQRILFPMKKKQDAYLIVFYNVLQHVKACIIHSQGSFFVTKITEESVRLFLISVTTIQCINIMYIITDADTILFSND